MRCEVLGLVDDDVLLRQGAATDVGERLDLELTALQQLRISAGAFLRSAREEELEVVEDRLHPGVQLLVDRAGKKADVTAERHHRARDEHARVGAVLDGAFKTGGERQERLAGAGLADERDEPDALVEQEVERVALFLVARTDAEQALTRRAEADDLTLRRVVAAERGVRGVRAVAEQYA